ncbi:hypothetical protein KAFR_0D03070 [Kazachstania africana CBS 2517]|uniref:Mitochondrial oxaloacetate transport protein n=1 Tax=Kazachstania africana (strain ATCC 22294 / BCRC 22015 / CBS 2517 / CECT 1963 / NBRC 1671 / NRRL Y-8276) TaxID=1071382 RepID=H2AUA5_KAZAF|nr:hypothetical protein KAFR_0D03070 [Kazachstania africana CBS 2517]CCF57955.1 hypothetical protein KAFR_0D03070 [Kazachstania africana CBS 2517]
MTKKEIEQTAAQKLSKVGSFTAGGLAACIAVTVTNPIEMIKTRLQLQGELSSAVSAQANHIYRNPLQAFRVIFKNEGIRGLQKGLFAAYFYQIGLNGSRLGFYEPIRKSLNQFFYSSIEPHKVQNVTINATSGAISGAIGGVVGSPLYLVKTRMQSYSNIIKMGDQTHYSGLWHGITAIFKENGIKGLFRGVDAAILRTSIGSAAQLPTYNATKNFFIRNDIMRDGPGLHLASSMVAGIVVTIIMNPWDVVLTRIYNQRDNRYKGPIDCMVKTAKVEGISALYKGFDAHLLRMAPHTIICLTAMEQTMKFVYSIESRILKP